jgi:hypothetical protein
MEIVGKLLAMLFWGAILLVIIGVVTALPFWALWNWLAPDIFSLPRITLLQGFGLILLVGILFGDSIKIEKR